MSSTSETPAPLWRQAFAHSLLGRRGFVKTIHMWLTVAVILWAGFEGEPPRLILAGLQYAIAVYCYAQACILVNDLADRRNDLDAGKKRWIRALGPRPGAAVPGALAVLGALALAPGAKSAWLFAAYGGALVAGLLYSVRPARLKNHGAWGLLAYSLSTAMAYALLPWTGLGGPWSVLLIAGIAVFLDKWVNIHFHQIMDYEKDRASGIRTFAVARGLAAARNTLQRMAALAALSMTGLLAFLAVSRPVWGASAAGLGAAAALASGIYARVKHNRQAEASPLARELPWVYLGLSWAVFRVVPLVLAAHVALDHPPMAALFVLLFLVVAQESWFLVRYRYD